MRNFFGVVRESVRYQLLTSALLGPGLKSSIASRSGGSVWVRTSLIQTGCRLSGGSSAPGEPPICALARQLPASFGSGFKFGLTGTRENPWPSAEVGQGWASLKLTEKIGV